LDEQAQQRWGQALQAAAEVSKSLAMGVLALDGTVIVANAGMRALLGVDDGEARPESRLMTPTFESLVRSDATVGVVFEGLMTFGDRVGAGVTLVARVTRHDDRLVIAAEPDVAEHQRSTETLTELNGEVNNLQRALIKEKRQLERTLEALRETQVMLVHSEKMNALGQLVAGVAHEINNPIAFVLSNVHSVGDLVDDFVGAVGDIESHARSTVGPAAAEGVQAIRRAAEIDLAFEDLREIQRASMKGLSRVKTIVDDLRRFSRLDEAARKIADVAEGIRGALAVAAPEIKKRGAEVTLDIDGVGELECYPAELNQVFLNIVINALHAVEPGGRLTVAARSSGDAVVITFGDDGVGIPDDVLPRIFDPFFTTKDVGEGTGLGLSLAYKIITDHHRGTIEARSVLGEGTTFTLTLPREQEAEEHR